MRQRYRDRARHAKTARGVAMAGWLVVTIIVLTHTATSAEIVDRVVAVVNDSIITLSELNAATAVVVGGLKEGLERGEDIIETRSKVLDKLIEKKLMKQSAEKAGIEVSDKEIDNAVEDVKKQNNIDQEKLEKALEASGITYNEYIEQITEEIRQAKFASNQFRGGIIITEEDIEDYYLRNTDDFYAPGTYSIRLIFLSRGDQRLYDRRLKAVMDGLTKGKALGDLAEEFSEGPAAKNGGLLTDIKHGEMEPALERAIEKLEMGEITGPITTRNGTSIIELIDREKGGSVPIEEVSAEIENILFKKKVDDKYNRWLDEMKRLAHIEIRF